MDPTAPSPTVAAASAEGLVHMRARDYDPATGQFLTPDPWVRPDGQPWVAVHSYADGDPVSFWDPDGLRPKHNGCAPKRDGRGGPTGCDVEQWVYRGVCLGPIGDAASLFGWGDAIRLGHYARAGDEPKVRESLEQLLLGANVEGGSSVRFLCSRGRRQELRRRRSSLFPWRQPSSMGLAKLPRWRQVPMSWVSEVMDEVTSIERHTGRAMVKLLAGSLLSVATGALIALAGAQGPAGLSRVLAPVFIPFALVVCFRHRVWEKVPIATGLPVGAAALLLFRHAGLPPATLVVAIQGAVMALCARLTHRRNQTVPQPPNPTA